jgi:brefeldin A-resistance guanine nucleotide exchange factor 1
MEICAILLGRVREEGFTMAVPMIGALKICYPGTRADDPEPLPPALAALEAELEKEKALEKSNGSQERGEVLETESRPPLSAKSPISSFGDTDIQDILVAETPMETIAPYSMALVMELLAHLIRLLEVGESRNTDRMRSLCLLVLTDFVEKNQQQLPSLALIWEVISAKLTRVLVQLLLNESPLLTTTLHEAVLAVFGRFRRRLLAATELFIYTLVTLLIHKPPPGKQPRVSREYYLDILAHFCLDPAFLADMYVLYECNPRFGYTLTEFVAGLVSTVQLEPKQSASQDYLFALEVIIMVLQALDGAGTVAECDPDPEKLCTERKLKLLMRHSAELFNQNPKDAFAFLEEHGLISTPATPKETAQYLRRTAGLDKRVIGEIVSKPANLELLNEFLADFNLSGLQIDKALRVVLESFRLPGESQQISRIMEALAQVYYRAQDNGVFRSEDAVFVLTYSIVMLNTDQHNKQVKHRMSVEDFIRNNRGINDGASFDEAFLRRIFHAIQSKEIVLPEEQAGETAFHYTWNEQLKKYPSSEIPPVFLLDGYVSDVIKLLWSPLLACFRSCTNNHFYANW